MCTFDQRFSPEPMCLATPAFFASAISHGTWMLCGLRPRPRP